MAGQRLSLLLLLALFGALQAQVVAPDAEVFNVGTDGTVVVNQPALPDINVNTSNEIHNNIPAPQIITIPAPVISQPQVVQPAVVTPTTTVVNPAPAVVNPGTTVVNPGTTVVNPGTTVVNPGVGIAGARYGVGMVPLGSLLMGRMGMGYGMGMGMGVRSMGLSSLMMPRMIIGR